MIKAILLSMVVASISFFITHTQLLEKQRKTLWQKSDFIAGLLGCCYCLGHWVAVAVLLIYPIRLFGMFQPLDYFLTWLVISWIAGLQSLAASRLWDNGG